eukprot:SAG25_NODE_1190_length_3656_cov_1.924656_2_plen_170_part_00
MDSYSPVRPEEAVATDETEPAVPGRRDAAAADNDGPADGRPPRCGPRCMAPPTPPAQTHTHTHRARESERETEGGEGETAGQHPARELACQLDSGRRAGGGGEHPRQVKQAIPSPPANASRWKATTIVCASFSLPSICSSRAFSSLFTMRRSLHSSTRAEFSATRRLLR